MNGAIRTAILSLLRDPELRAEIISVVREAAPPPEAAEPERLLTAAELARSLRISVATVRRLDPPHVVVGDVKTRRYHLEVVNSWLATREPKPTTPPVKR